MINYENMCMESVPVKEYITDSIEKTEKFQEHYENYQPNMATLKKLQKYSKDIVVYGFSAEWCPDCYRNVPVMAHISEQTGIEVRIFGNLMRDAKSDTKIWACPPSPKKVNEFQIIKIPTFILVNGSGKEIGRIIENPPEGQSWEETLLKILIDTN
jgi:thiol-disulfide isomerase/thioredoxin